MAEAAISPKQIRKAAVPPAWWVEPVFGLVAIVAGAVILAQPGDSIKTLMVISGIFVVLDSVFELATAMRRDTDSRALGAIIGVLGLVAGIVLIRHPVTSAAAVTLILGIWLIAMGVVRLISTFDFRRSLWGAVLGPVQIVAGIIIVANPHIGLATLALLTGLSFIANGIVMIGLGWMARTDVPRPHGPVDAVAAS